MRKIKINQNLSLEQLEVIFKKTIDSVEKSHIQVIMLYLQGKITKEIKEITKFTDRWLYEIVSRYNKAGIEGIKDNRHNNPGAPTLLSENQLAELNEELKKQSPDMGLWNGPKVAKWISEKIKRSVNNSRGWCYLKRLDYKLKSPRPRHENANDKVQEEYKKKFWKKSKKLKKNILKIK